MTYSDPMEIGNSIHRWRRAFIREENSRSVYAHDTIIPFNKCQRFLGHRNTKIPFCVLFSVGPKHFLPRFYFVCCRDH